MPNEMASLSIKLNAEFASAVAEVAFLAADGAATDRALQAIADRALALAGAESVSIGITTLDGMRLDIVAVAGRDARQHEFAFRIEGSIAEEALRDRRPVVGSQMTLPLLEPGSSGRYAVTPIRHSVRTIGALIAYEGEADIAPSLPILDALAALVPLALGAGELTRRNADQAIELSVLYDVATKIGLSRSLDEVYAALVESIWQHLRPRTVSLFLLNDDKTHLLLADHHGLPAALHDVQLQVDHALLAATLAGRGSARLTELTFEQELGSFFPDLEVRSALLAPVLGRTEALGVILVTSSESGALEEHGSELLSTMGYHAGAAIQNALLAEDEQRRSVELNALYAVAQNLGSTMDQQRILEHVVAHVRDLLGVDGAAVFLTDHQSDSLVNQCYKGPDLPGLAALRPRRGEGIPGWVLEHLVAASITKVSDDPRNSSLPISGVESLVCLPLSSTQRDYGVLLALSLNGRSFAAREIQLLDTIARHACVAVENATAYREARIKSQTRGRSFNRIAAALGANASEAEIPDEICQIVLAMTEADACAFYLVEGDTLTLRTSFGVRPAHLEPIPEIGHGLAGWVARRGRFLTVEDLSVDHRAEAHTALVDRFASYLAVPIRKSKATVGVLEVYCSVPRTFLREESELLGRFVKHARMADRVRRSSGPADAPRSALH